VKNPYMNVFDWLQHLGAENKQGNIPVEECQDIIKKLGLKAFEGKYKILIMWMAEYLKQAGNVLLKTLEEPPQNTVLILVAENQDLMLNTILSRTQLVKANHLADDAIANALKLQYDMAEEQVNKAVQLAEGDYNKALQIVNESSADYEEVLKKWLRACHEYDGIKIISWVEDIVRFSKEEQKRFLDYVLHILRECILLGYGNENLVRLEANELDIIKYLKKLFEVEQVEHLLEKISKEIYYIERNANPKLVFTSLSFSLAKALNKQPLVAV